MSNAANDNDQAALPASEEQGTRDRDRDREDHGLDHEEGTRRFERRLAHPPEKVWRALTEEAELAHWFPALVEGEHALGAELRFTERDGERDGDSAHEQSGFVTEYDPPRRLEYTWGDETLRWELSPVPGGCLLVFTTTSGRARRAASDRIEAKAFRLAA